MIGFDDQVGPDSQLVADLKTRVRNQNITITTLAKQVEALETRVLAFRVAADRMEEAARAKLDWFARPEIPGYEAGLSNAVAAYRAVRDETGNKTSDEPGAGDREDRNRDGDTEGRVGSEPGSSVPSAAAVTPDCQGGEGPGPNIGSSPDLSTGNGKQELTRVIHGALRGAINDHGPIELVTAHSAAKRVAGQIKSVTIDRAEDIRADERRRIAEAGSSPDLPADLIDRAIWAADREYSSTSFTTAAPHSQRLCAAVKGVAPLLIEHGRQQEREKWVARIEMKAAERDAAVASETRQANLASEQGRYRGAAASKDSADWFESQAQLLRSLLNEAGADR